MSRKVPRNAPCPCGSGIKFKKCCLGGKKQDGIPVPKRIALPRSLSGVDPEFEKFKKSLCRKEEEEGDLDREIRMIFALNSMSERIPETLARREAKGNLLVNRWKKTRAIWPWASRLSYEIKHDPMNSVRRAFDILWYDLEIYFEVQKDVLYFKKEMPSGEIFTPERVSELIDSLGFYHFPPSCEGDWIRCRLD